MRVCWLKYVGVLGVLLWLSACDGCTGLPYCYVDADCGPALRCLAGACQTPERLLEAVPDEQPYPKYEAPTDPVSETVSAADEAPVEPAPLEQPADAGRDEPAPEPQREGPALSDAPDVPGVPDVSEVPGVPEVSETTPEPMRESVPEGPLPLCQQVVNVAYAKDKGWVRQIDGDNRLSSTGFDGVKGLVVDRCGFPIFCGQTLPGGDVPGAGLHATGPGAAYLVRANRGGKAVWGWRSSATKQNNSGRAGLTELFLDGDSVWIGGSFTFWLYLTNGTGALHRLPPTSGQKADSHDLFLANHKISDMRPGTVSFRQPSWYGGFRRDAMAQVAMDKQKRVHILGHFESARFSLPARVNSFLFARPTNGPTITQFYAHGQPTAFSHARQFESVEIKAFHVDDAGNVYLAGEYAKDITVDKCQFKRTSTREVEVFLARFVPKAQGTTLSCEEVLVAGGAKDKSYATAMTRLGPKQLLFAGYVRQEQLFGGVLLKEPPKTTRSSGFIAAFDLGTKKTLWGAVLASNNGSRVRSIQVDSAGDVYVAGGFVQTLKIYQANKLLHTETSQAPHALHVTKWSAAGKLLWVVSVGINKIALDPLTDPYDGDIPTLGIGPLGHVYAGGWFRGKASFPLAWQGQTPLFQQGAEVGPKSSVGKSAGFLWKVPIPPQPLLTP